MKTYKERTDAVSAKLRKLQAKRQLHRGIAVTSCLCAVSLAIVMVLFLPFSTKAPDVSRYSDSPYYALIQKINEATYEKPRHKNNFEVLKNYLYRNVMEGMGNAGADREPMEPPMNSPIVEDDLFLDSTPTGNGNYVEVTDNQVSGVTEADIIKRSDRYIYYLRHGELRIYSIAQEKSVLVSTFRLTSEAREGEEILWYEGAEMYLSKDCNTVFIVQTCNWKDQNRSGTNVCVTSLDVSDVKNIRQKDQIFMSGNYLSSRMVDGDLLLMSQYYVRSDRDFSDESSFLPCVGRKDAMEPVAAEDIFAPDELTTTRYTVVCKLDGDTMEVQDSAAFLSYSQELYVSRDVIYATFAYVENTDTCRRNMTEITALRYSAEGMENLGTVKIAGTVKDQYSMDEYNGILRVVTSTSETVTGTEGEFSFAQNKRNVNLYCIRLENMEVAATVEAFAPEGETAESVRFDGTVGYVCTAEVITLTDPVYFFDLSDIQNITWKDTGTIDGYSSSLVNMGDGYLLGIGFSGSFGLKIEVYEETAEGVQSVCAYEKDASFSNQYKAYLIDRENDLVGLGIYDYGDGTYRYILLMFDGYQLVEVFNGKFDSELHLARAFVTDGWLYLLGNELHTAKLW